MTIKYRELTVINNEQTKLESLVCWIKNTKNNYIFLLEDGEKVVDF